MATLKIQITKTDADAMADALDTAIMVLEAEHFKANDEVSIYPAALLRTAIESLQMIRVTYLLASRNAAKEAAPKSDNGDNYDGPGHNLSDEYYEMNPRI